MQSNYNYIDELKDRHLESEQYMTRVNMLPVLIDIHRFDRKNLKDPFPKLNRDKSKLHKELLATIKHKNLAKDNWFYYLKYRFYYGEKV